MPLHLLDGMAHETELRLEWLLDDNAKEAHLTFFEGHRIRGRRAPGGRRNDA